MMSTYREEEKKNLSILLGMGNGKIDVGTICEEAGYFGELVREKAEQAFRDYLDACTPTSELTLSPNWTLCTMGSRYNCDSVYNYTSTCRAKSSINCADAGDTGSTIPNECAGCDGLVMGEGNVWILVGLVFIGLLVGVAATVAVCLICPRVHYWANSKIRGNLTEEKQPQSQRVSAGSAYYAYVDNRNNTGSIRLQPQISPPVFTTTSGDSLPTTRSPANHSVGLTDPAYTDSGIPDYDEPDNRQNSERYEHLMRGNAQNQSHKYAHLDSSHVVVSLSESDDGSHAYCVLEKKA